MDVLIFLEQLAAIPYYNPRYQQLIAQQSAIVRKALDTNSRSLLETQISSVKSVADTIMVAEA